MLFTPGPVSQWHVYPRYMCILAHISLVICVSLQIWQPGIFVSPNLLPSQFLSHATASSLPSFNNNFYAQDKWILLFIISANLQEQKWFLSFFLFFFVLFSILNIAEVKRKRSFSRSWTTVYYVSKLTRTKVVSFFFFFFVLFSILNLAEVKRKRSFSRSWTTCLSKEKSRHVLVKLECVVMCQYVHSHATRLSQ